MIANEDEEEEDDKVDRAWLKAVSSDTAARRNKSGVDQGRVIAMIDQNRSDVSLLLMRQPCQRHLLGHRETRELNLAMVINGFEEKKSGRNKQK